MRVLLITFSFPPVGGVGVLRALSLAKYLPESGIQVDVLTARNAPAIKHDASLAKQVPASVKIHRCWTLDLPFGLRKAIKRMVSKPGAANGISDAARSSSKEPGLLKRLLGAILLPDPQIGWLPFAVPAAARLIRKHKFDLALITVPPFSSVLLVKKLRQLFPALPIVLDFRDEWLDTTLHLVSFSHTSRALRIAQVVEAEAVRDATAVVTVTKGADRVIRARYPEQPSTKFHCIPNGFETLPKATNPHPSEQEIQKTTPARVVFTFIGSVYGSSDPSTFVEAVRLLPAETRDRVLLRFIGHIESPVMRQTLLSLGDTVELRNFVPQAEALQAIASTHYLLLISHDPINVAAKFYDYLGSEKPILAAIRPDGDIREILEDTRAGMWADVDDSVAICRLLRLAVEQVNLTQASFRPFRSRIAAYHREPLTKRYSELLKALICTRRREEGSS